MASYIPLQRTQMILAMLEKYFGTEILSSIPDDILGQLIGVLPKTVCMARQYKVNQAKTEQINLNVVAV